MFLVTRCHKYQNCWLYYNFDRGGSDCEAVSQGMGEGFNKLKDIFKLRWKSEKPVGLLLFYINMFVNIIIATTDILELPW